MKSKSTELTALLMSLIALTAGTPVAEARDNAVQASCFAPETLGAVAGENIPVKGDRRFDPAAAKLELQPIAPIASELRGSIRRVDLPAGKKLIALTFDLCEDRGEVAGYEGRIFDYLRAQNIKATLFAGGKWLRSHVARTQQLMTDPLFEMANHAEAHRNLRKLQGPALSEEIAGPQRSYEGIRAQLATTQCAAPALQSMQSVQPRLGLFRFPFGACNAPSLAAVNDAGLLAIQWDVSSGDPDPHMSATAVAEQIVRHARPGSIIVSHANGRGWSTAEALPIAIPKLKALGYQFVTVSELIASGRPVIADTCYDSRPGDTDRYDDLAALHNRKPVLPWSTAPGHSAKPAHGWQSTLEPTAETPAKKEKREPSYGGTSSIWPF